MMSAHDSLIDQTYIVTGGAGFIGSHLVDHLVQSGAKQVVVIDTLLSGQRQNINPAATLHEVDIRDFRALLAVFQKYAACGGPRCVFHTAAIARTPWTIDDPNLCIETNVLGTQHVLEACRVTSVPRVVLSSSNVVYAAYTPYRMSKEALENLGRVYTDVYGMSVLCLRYSNVWGTRQSEEGPSPNVFAALRASMKKNGYLEVTGDGEQSRQFTHVSDIVQGNVLASQSRETGVIDLCTGENVTLNEIAKLYGCPVRYIDERRGDVKHIVQDPTDALKRLGWKAKVRLQDRVQEIIS
jgi:nucleoside-diphosphate-sugar epimerase